MLLLVERHLRNWKLKKYLKPCGVINSSLVTDLHFLFSLLSSTHTPLDNFLLCTSTELLSKVSFGTSTVSTNGVLNLERCSLNKSAHSSRIIKAQTQQISRSTASTLLPRHYFRSLSRKNELKFAQNNNTKQLNNCVICETLLLLLDSNIFTNQFRFQA